MVQEVKAEKTVYSKTELSSVLDRSFSTFTTGSTDVELSVEEFFSEYERLYFSIPTSGDINSHEYLVARSSQLSGYLQNASDIQNFLDEIANLREQLLEATQTIVQLRTIAA